MADLISLYNFARQGADEGKARGIQSLIGKAAANPADRQKFLGMAAQSDPKAAFDAQKFFADDDGRKRTEVAKRVSVLMSMPQEQRAQMYASMAPEFQAMGIPAPAQYDPSFDEPMRAIAATYGTGEQGAPTGYRQFELTAQAGGLKPGTPEYQQAARVALGLEGRASSAGFGFELIKGMDGRERMARKNPRTGAVEVYDEMTGDFVPMGGGVAMGGSMPPARMPSAPLAEASGMPVVFDDPQNIDPTVMAAIQSNPTAFGAAQDGATARIPEQVRQFAPQRAPANLGVSRSPEEQAAATTAATEQAKINAQIASYDRMTGLEADRAGRVASAQASGKEQAEVAGKAATRVRDAQQTLGLLDEAERLLQTASGGRLEAGRDAVAGAFNVTTEGAKATASLKLIAADLVSKVPRFEGPQSNIDVQFYREAAGDLANDQLPVGTRLAALQTMRQLRQKYAGQPKRTFSQQEVLQKITEARQAIQRGADPEAVKRRLTEMGLQNAAGRL